MRVLGRGGASIKCRVDSMSYILGAPPLSGGLVERASYAPTSVHRLCFVVDGVVCG
jgi:hypothetical protein